MLYNALAILLYKADRNARRSVGLGGGPAKVRGFVYYMRGLIACGK